MHIVMSQKKRLGFLVIASVVGVALTASLLTQIISRHDALRDKSILELIVLPEVLFSVGLLIVMIGYSFYRVNRKVSDLLDEALESLASGIIFFEIGGALSRFNPAAAIMLPELSESEMSRNFIGTYKKFLAFVYDHSLDIQDQSHLTLDIVQLGISRLLFREVVQLTSRRIVLVQFYQRPSQDIIVVMTDISMMKHHIEELASLTEENRIMIKAIEASGSGMVIAQASEAAVPIIFANEIFTNIIHGQPESLLNKSFYEVFEERFGDQVNIIKTAIQTARREGKTDAIWLKMRKDKRIVLWYSFHILFFIDNNNHEFFVCFLVDQTQAKFSQAKIFQTQKLEAVSQLAGGIAHDFNNILSVIDGFSKIIQRGLVRGTDVLPLFENIDRSVLKGTQITSRLLTLGQCRVTQKIKMDVCTHIRDLEAFLKPIVGSTINMIISAQDLPAYIESSPDTITQILLNLVSNAAESMPDGGDLIISIADASRSQILASQKTVNLDQNYICLQVIDSGMGMDQETLARIYEPFFTTKDLAKNSGLGMSLVYGLVKEMEAFMDIKSTPEVGTSVSILIPAQTAPEYPLITRQKISGTIGNLIGKTILIVEDSADVLEMESQLLSDTGLKVLKAVNAAEALRLQANYEGRIDFLLVDVTMPEMNGIELSERFATQRPESKIILISAYPALASLRGGHDNFPQDCIILAKPFVYAQLEEVLIKLAIEEDFDIRKNHHWTHEKA